MRLSSAISILLLFFLVFLLPQHSVAEKDSKIVNSGNKKSYICTLGTLIWNQDKPCEQETPVRDQMFKMYKASAPEVGRDSPMGVALPSKTSANLSQLVNYPEEYLRQTVQMENLWLYGNIYRNRNSSLPSDKSSVVVIQDKFARKVAVALDNSIGLRFADQLQPDKVYPIEEVLISVQALEEGYLPFIKGLKFGSSKPRAVKTNFKYIPNPILGRNDQPHRNSGQDSAQYDSEYGAEFALPPQDQSTQSGAEASIAGTEAKALAPRLPLGEDVDFTAAEQSGLEQREQNYDPKIFGQRHYNTSSK